MKEEKTDDSAGQNPQWPGEKSRNPGRYDKTARKLGDGELTEETIVPIVDTIPGKQSDGHERD